jgi:hypothetical protein
MSWQADGNALKTPEVLVMYGSNAPFTSTVIEGMRSYATCSCRSVFLSPIHGFDPGSHLDFTTFDVATLHYSFFPGL